MAAPPKASATKKNAPTTRARQYHKRPSNITERTAYNDWNKAKKSAEESWRVTAQRATLKVYATALKNVKDAMQVYPSSRDTITPNDQREILDKIAAHLASMDKSLDEVRNEESSKRRRVDELLRDDKKTYMDKTIELRQFLELQKTEPGFADGPAIGS